MQVNLNELSDDHIVNNASGQVLNNKDYRLGKNHLITVQHGLFDKSIFGTFNKCTCKNRVLQGTCKICSDKVVMNDSEMSKLYGYFNTVSYYINFFKLRELSNSNYLNYFFDDSLINIGITKKISHPTALFFGFLIISKNKDVTPNSNFKTSNGFEYPYYSGIVDGDTDLSEYENNQDDYDVFININGAVDFLNKYTEFNDNVILRLAHSKLVIVSSILRPSGLLNLANGQKIVIDSITAKYKVIIDYVNRVFPDGDKNLYNSYTVYQKCVHASVIQKMVELIHKSYNIFQSSKENQVTQQLNIRVGKSGRSIIVGEPKLPMDTISIPRDALYVSLRTEIIESLIKKGSSRMEAYDNYNKMSYEALNELENIVSTSSCLFKRDPSLHRYNIMAFKIKIDYENSVIKMPVQVTSLFNADFDGDTMAYFILTDPKHVEFSLNNMTSRQITRFSLTDEVMYKPTHEMLQGLYFATKIESLSPTDLPTYNDDQIKDLLINKKLTNKCRFMFENKVYNLGRYRISKLLNIDINTFIGDEPINAKNIVDIMQYINSQSNNVELIGELNRIAHNVNIRLGSLTFNWMELYKNFVDSKVDYKEILESNLPEHDKIAKLNIKLVKHYTKLIKGLTDSTEIFESNERNKANSMTAMVVPLISTYDNQINVSKSNIITGMDLRTFINHMIATRELNVVKADLTPGSGYLTKQLFTIFMDIIYSKINKTDYTEFLTIQRKFVLGRYDDKGELIQSNGNNNDFVRVQSCIFNNTQNIIYKNELNHKLGNELVNGSHIGTDLATQLTERITQFSLSLKHGLSKILTETFGMKAVDDLVYLGYERVRDYYLIKFKIQSTNEPIEYITRANDFDLFTDVDTIFKKGTLLFNNIKSDLVDKKFRMFKTMLDTHGDYLLSKTDRTEDYLIINSKDTKLSIKNNKIVTEDGEIIKDLTIVEDDTLINYPLNYTIPKYNVISDRDLTNESLLIPTTLNDKYLLFFKILREHLHISSDYAEILFKRLYELGFSSKSYIKGKANISTMDELINLGKGWNNEKLLKLLEKGSINLSNASMSIYFGK